MANKLMSDILKLSPAERLLLVEDVWDSIATLPEAVHLTEEQIQELDRRLENYHNNPNEGSPWEEVKARILHLS